MEEAVTARVLDGLHNLQIKGLNPLLKFLIREEPCLSAQSRIIYAVHTQFNVCPCQLTHHIRNALHTCQDRIRILMQQAAKLFPYLVICIAGVHLLKRMDG